MEGKNFYGSDTRFNRNDFDDSGKFTSSTYGAEENKETDDRPHLDLGNSNRYLDQFLFYHSSLL